MQNYTQYTDYLKPSWAPPAWLFGPVWSVLYALIIVSYGYVGYLFFMKKIPFMVVLPFILNIFFNVIFTWIQFGLRNFSLAAIDILLVLGTLIWAMVVIFPYAKWVTWINIPYLLWVSFATVLQLTVTFMNR
ncbi:MAG: TspO/MBR family protein [Candidatus Paceibacterota bacterium]